MYLQSLPSVSVSVFPAINIQYKALQLHIAVGQ